MINRISSSLIREYRALLPQVGQGCPARTFFYRPIPV
jgi:hypothetical protein